MSSDFEKMQSYGKSTRKVRSRKFSMETDSRSSKRKMSKGLKATAKGLVTRGRAAILRRQDSQEKI